MVALGGMYVRGEGVTKDYGKAIQWFQKAVDAGEPVAMYNLGLMYRDGVGVAKDYDKAREWLQKAADAGDKDAKQELARLGNQP
jgi:TPR repeat protein